MGLCPYTQQGTLPVSLKTTFTSENSQKPLNRVSENFRSGLSTVPKSFCFTDLRLFLLDIISL